MDKLLQIKKRISALELQSSTLFFLLVSSLVTPFPLLIPLLIIFHLPYAVLYRVILHFFPGISQRSRRYSDLIGALSGLAVGMVDLAVDYSLSIGEFERSPWRPIIRIGICLLVEIPIVLIVLTITCRKKKCEPEADD